MSGPARFSPQAQREILRALRELEQQSVREALLSALVVAVRRLAEHPQYGRPAASYLPDTYRFWSLPRFGYVLVYDPSANPVQILRFVHTKRDLPRTLTVRSPTDEEP